MSAFSAGLSKVVPGRTVTWVERGGALGASPVLAGLDRRTIKTGSAKQKAEKQTRATTKRKSFRTAKGWILIKTILVMVFKQRLCHPPRPGEHRAATYPLSQNCLVSSK